MTPKGHQEHVADVLTRGMERLKGVLDLEQQAHDLEAAAHELLQRALPTPDDKPLLAPQQDGGD